MFRHLLQQPWGFFKRPMNDERIRKKCIAHVLKENNIKIRNLDCITFLLSNSLSFVSCSYNLLMRFCIAERTFGANVATEASFSTSGKLAFLRSKFCSSPASLLESDMAPFAVGWHSNSDLYHSN